MTGKRTVYGENIGKPPIKVRHSELVRDGESRYRSKCPSCRGGILLVHRHQETFELKDLDICIACGQAFIYEDIQALRKLDEGE